MFFGGTYKGPGDMWLPAKITIDYDNLQYFRKYVDPSYDLQYLILVTNQYGPDKINVYGRVEPRQPKEDVKDEDTDSEKKRKKKRNKGLEQEKENN